MRRPLPVSTDLRMIASCVSDGNDAVTPSTDYPLGLPFTPGSEARVGIPPEMWEHVVVRGSLRAAQVVAQQKADEMAAGTNYGAGAVGAVGAVGEPASPPPPARPRPRPPVVSWKDSDNAFIRFHTQDDIDAVLAASQKARPSAPFKSQLIQR